MRFSSFLRAKLVQIGAFSLIFLIFFSNFLLWHLPLASLLNPTGLALLVLVAYLTLSYLRWRKVQGHLLELTQRAEDLSKSLKALELSSKEQDDLLRVWSHQMKVPLAAIDLMAQTKVEPDELRNQVFTLGNYLNLLLEIQRIKNVVTDFRFERVSAAAVSKDLIKKYSRFFIQKNLSVTLRGDWFLTTDRRWFSLALEQLVNNAVKYTDTGGLTFVMSKNSLSLTDTGIGILPEDLPRLFEHGFTGFNGHRQQQKSSGLGLYLSKLIFDKLNFQLTVDSEVGVGTTVTVRKTSLDD